MFNVLENNKRLYVTPHPGLRALNLGTCKVNFKIFIVQARDIAKPIECLPSTQHRIK